MTVLAMPVPGRKWRDRISGDRVTILEVGTRALVHYPYAGRTTWLGVKTLRQEYEPVVRVRHTALGSMAVYDQVTDDDAFVSVEVVEGPGLRPGERLCFTRAAFEAMERV